MKICYLSGLKPGEKIYINSVQYYDYPEFLAMYCYFIDNYTGGVHVFYIKTLSKISAVVYYKNTCKYFVGLQEKPTLKTYIEVQYPVACIDDKFFYLIRPRHLIEPKHPVIKDHRIGFYDIIFVLP